MTPTTAASPGHWKTLDISFDEALELVPGALAREGFGVLTHIDVQQTFATKLGKAFPRYRIFGACNPTLAHAVLTETPHMGVMLPCNVVVTEAASGKAEVGVVDPMQTLGGTASTSETLARVASDVAARLGRVLDGLAANHA